VQVQSNGDGQSGRSLAYRRSIAICQVVGLLVRRLAHLAHNERLIRATRSQRTRCRLIRTAIRNAFQSICVSCMHGAIS